MSQYHVLQEEATGEWLVCEVLFADYGTFTVPLEIDRVDSWPTKEAAEAALRSIPTAAPPSMAMASPRMSAESIMGRAVRSYSTRSSRGLGRCHRPCFATCAPSTRTMSAVKSNRPANRDEPTP